jgi:16S rRNA G966 N2-methylase RsmD
MFYTDGATTNGPALLGERTMDAVGSSYNQWAVTSVERVAFIMDVWTPFVDASFDLVFCDPPYRLADRLGPTLDQLISDRIGQDGRVIVESDARHPLELTLPVWVQRRYGDTLIRVHGSAQNGA